MRLGHSTTYVLGFAAAICIVCSLAISGTALGLRDLQNMNIEIDKKKNVLAAAGLVVAKEKVLETFKAKVQAKVVNLKSGKVVETAVADLPHEHRRRPASPRLFGGPRRRSGHHHPHRG
jgi:Na+-transporting NADH:ubiquinone oxidoreductase subunit NqrC